MKIKTGIALILILFAITQGMSARYYADLSDVDTDASADIESVSYKESINVDYHIKDVEEKQILLEISNNTDDPRKPAINRGYESIEVISEDHTIENKRVHLDPGETAKISAKVDGRNDINDRLKKEGLLYVPSGIYAVAPVRNTTEEGVFDNKRSGILTTEKTYTEETQTIGGRSITVANFTKEELDSKQVFSKLERVDNEMNGGYSQHQNVTAFVLPLGYEEKLMGKYASGLAIGSVFLVKRNSVDRNMSVSDTVAHEYVHILQPKQKIHEDKLNWIVEGSAQYLSLKSNYTETHPKIEHTLRSGTLSAMKITSVVSQTTGLTERGYYYTGYVDIHHIDQAIKEESNGEKDINVVFEDLSNSEGRYTYEEFKETSIQYGGGDAREVFETRENGDKINITAMDIINPFTFYSLIHSTPLPTWFSNLYFSSFTVIALFILQYSSKKFIYSILSSPYVSLE